jgi:serine/alanine adding enzyme
MTSDEIRIETVGDSDASAWDAFVASAAESSFYHKYGWRQVVARSFERETHYLAARRAGRICGVFPIVRLKSLLFGDSLISVPYFNYGGAIAETPEIEQRLLAAGCELARKLGVTHLEMRYRGAKDTTDFAVRTDKVTMLIELPPSSETLWKSLRSNVRNQVRRGQKNNGECVQGSLDLLDEFYAVFAENMRDLGTPVYSKKFFANILEAFPNETRIFAVRHQGQPVAAGLVLFGRESVEVPWASSLRSANPLGLNRLFHWSVLESACQKGYRMFDFGRSTADSGTYKYKEEWGAKPSGLHWYYWLRDGGEPPKVNPTNPKYRLAIKTWQRLPLAVANALGPMLVRNLP